MKLIYLKPGTSSQHGAPGRALKFLAAAGLSALLLNTTAFKQGTAPVVSCESLARLALQDTAITMTQSVGAGEFKAPERERPRETDRSADGKPFVGPPKTDDKPVLAFCRVVATLRPSNDSDIKIEVWLPLSGWNGKFWGEGNGGTAGEISYQGLVDVVQRGYAAASTATA